MVKEIFCLIAIAFATTSLSAQGKFDGGSEDGYASALAQNQSLSAPVIPSKLSQSITFPPLSSKSYGDGPFLLNATASSGLPVSYTSSNLNVADVSGNTVTIFDAGTITITASQAGDATYNAATTVQQILIVKKANQKITFEALNNKLTTDASFALTATSNSGLPVKFSTSDAQIIEIKDKTVTIIGAGIATIIASQAGNSNYSAAVEVARTLTVNKANQVITFAALPNKVATDVAFDLLATSSSGLAVQLFTDDTNVIQISGVTVKLVGAGVAKVTASQSGDFKYLAATEVMQTLTVDKADQAIVFSPLTQKLTTSTPFSLLATASSGLPIEYSCDNINVATVNGNTVTVVGAGVAVISASQDGNHIYNSASIVTQTLTVERAPQILTFNPFTNKVTTDAPFDLTAKSSSGLPVSFTSSNTNVATVNENIVTIRGAGTTTITASQPGDSKFLPALNLDQTLTVLKANQSIAFVVLSDKILGDTAFELTATASSALEVTYSTTTQGKISIAGATVILTAPGQATIIASQTGNDIFNAAPEESRTFCINPPKPLILLSNENTANPTLTSSAASGNQWFMNGLAILGATGTTLSVIEAGVYYVDATVETCKSQHSNELAVIVTGDLQELAFGTLIISPNPSSEYIDIRLPGSLNKVMTIFDLSGALIERRDTYECEVKVDVRSYASGFYLVRVVTNSRTYFGKFIKN